jgi:hypothetical protein
MGCIAGWRRPLERKDRSSRSYPDTGYWKVYGGHEMITTHETVHSRGVPSPGPSLCLSFFVNFFPLGVDCLAFFLFSHCFTIAFVCFPFFLSLAILLRWSSGYSSARRGGVFLLHYSFLALFFAGSLGFSFTTAFCDVFPCISTGKSGLLQRG